MFYEQPCFAVAVVDWCTCRLIDASCIEFQWVDIEHATGFPVAKCGFYCCEGSFRIFCSQVFLEMAVRVNSFQGFTLQVAKPPRLSTLHLLHDGFAMQIQ